MAVDAPLRRALAGLGVRFVTESAVVHWDGKSAKVTSLLDGTEQQIVADALVFANTNLADDTVSRELGRRGVSHTSIGDCTASRQAAFAIHDGRKVALAI
jgi:hypothetical protein